MILYHYTSKSAFAQIIESNTIKPSDPWTTMDSAYGYGFYFTDLHPTECKALIVAYCWRNLSASIFKKVEYYLEFNIPADILKCCRKHVYMVSTMDWNNQTDFIDGKPTEKCIKEPCHICKVIPNIKLQLRI